MSLVPLRGGSDLAALRARRATRPPGALALARRALERRGDPNTAQTAALRSTSFNSDNSVRWKRGDRCRGQP